MNARSLALVSFAALLVPSVAAAEASFYVPLNDMTLTTAKVKIRDLLAKEGRDSKLGDLLLELDAFASLDDDQCPGFTVDVLNASDRTLWAVAVTVEQESGTKKKSDVVHLPYLPAKTQTKVAVTCLEDYSYSYSRYSMYDKSTTISVDPYAKSPRGLADGLTAMVSTKADTSYASATLSRTGAGAKSLLEVALAMNDPAITKELVAAIASTGVGAKELGAALATNEALAAVVAEQLASLPANQQAKLARALLASTAAEKWVDQLTPLIDKLCNGGRPEVVALWAAAQGPRNIPVASLRDRVRAKCTLLPTDAGTLVASLESAPTYAGDALDATTEPVFAAVVAKWKAAAKVVPEDEDAPIGPPPSLYAYLANTNDPKRFDQAIALVPATSRTDAITAIVQGTPSGAEASPAAPRKQAWLDEAVASSDASAKDTIVGDLFGKLLDGHIQDPAMRLAVRALKVHAPHEAEGVIIAYTNAHSKVYDSVKLGEAGIDVFDFLAFATEHLADCPASLEALEACADAVAASKLPLTKHGDALQPEFASSVQHLVTGLITKRQMVDSAKRLTAAGWSVQFAVDNLCSNARDAIRWNGDMDEPMALVKELPGGDACIATISDEAAAKKRTVTIMTILALLGLILPIPAGAMWIRRKWHKLQAAIPKATVDVALGARRDDRLGADGLGRALTAQVTAARVATSIAGLATVDAAVIERAAAVVRRAVKSGDAATQLVRANGLSYYLVALPVKHARPQVVARYLGTEWPAHLESIRASTGGPVVALVVLCAPDATEATLLVASIDGTGTVTSDPDALLDAKEARARNANTFRGQMSLAVSAPITTEKAA